MLKVGLTGGIGSGKTTASDIFSESGVPVIDADIIARRMLDTGQPAFEETIQLFGNTILDKSSHIDRQALRDLVFDDPDKRVALEQIIHPRVRAAIEKETASLQADYCLVVIPLLIESGMRNLVDRVLVITADPVVRAERIQKRDKTSLAEIRKIMDTQIDEKERLSYADDVLVNNSDVAGLRNEIKVLQQEYHELARSRS